MNPDPLHDLPAIQADPLNRALGLWPCVYSLHDPEGRPQVFIATENPKVFAVQMHFWRRHFAAGWTVIQWNHGLPVVSYGDPAA